MLFSVYQQSLQATNLYSENLAFLTSKFLNENLELVKLEKKDILQDI